MQIRETTDVDFEDIWPIFNEITSAGETYAYPQNTSKEKAYEVWMKQPRKTFVAERVGKYLERTTLKQIKKVQVVTCVIVVIWFHQRQEEKA